MSGDVTANVAATAAITIIVSAWAALYSWAAPLVILVALATFALGLFIMNQLRTIAALNVLGTNEELRVALREWLRFGYSVVETRKPGALLILIAGDPAGREINIIRSNDDPEFVHVAGMVTLSEDRLKMIAALPEHMRAEMIEDMRIEMARLGLEYSGLIDPIVRIDIHTRIAVTRLNEDTLYEAMQRIRSAYILLSELIFKACRIGGTQQGHDTGGSQL